MPDRYDGPLDGTVERTALTPDERARADEVERVIGELRRFVTARPVPDLTGDVMRRIRQAGLSPAKSPRSDPFRRLVESLWTSRQVTFQFRPVYMVLASAAIALLALLLPYGPRTSVATSAPVAAVTQPRVFVQFRLQVREASSVRLAGSFTDWQPLYELHETAPDLWTVTLPLPCGVHDYAFVVDGSRWVPDPYALQIDDGFGGTGSRIALLPPDPSQS